MLIGLCLVLGYAVLPRLDPAEQAAVGQQAEDFVLPVIHGGDPENRLRLSDLRGRIVVLEFWASWCEICQRQIPVLEEFERTRADPNVVLVGISLDDDPDAAVAFARSRSLGYVSLRDPDHQVAIAYEAQQLPTLVVVDPQGRVSAHRRGLVSRHELEQFVAEAGGRARTGS